MTAKNKWIRSLTATQKMCMYLQRQCLAVSPLDGATDPPPGAETDALEIELEMARVEVKSMCDGKE